MEKHLKLALLLFSAVAGTTLVLYFVANKTKTNLPSTNLPISAFTPSDPLTGTAEQVSPDGTKTLIMERQKKDNAETYNFSIINHADNTKKQILSKTVGKGETISIPHNAWSPDYKYLFLKQTSGSKDNYFVLSAEGTPVAKSEQTVSISDLFAEKLPDYKVTDMTGWAGPTLVVINTDKSDGAQGPSFWFDLSNLSFIQLSRRFN